VKCRDCNATTTAASPPMPLERASCTFGTLAALSYLRFGLFLPLDRIQRDSEHQGFPQSSSSLTRWDSVAGELSVPLADAVRLEMLASTDHLGTDATGINLLLPKVKGKPKVGPERAGEVDAKGFLVQATTDKGQVNVWTSSNHICFHATPDKSGKHNATFLDLGPEANGAKWQGTITADAASTNHALYGSDRIEAGCNAHGFMNFEESAPNAPLIATEAMRQLSAVFDIEREAKRNGIVGPELLSLRRSKSAPLMKKFRKWLIERLPDLLPTNPVRKAMQYYITHWEPLTRFLSDPEVPIDNNLCERLLRNVDLIRNNLMFVAGQSGLKQLCARLTLIHTCRRIGVNSIDYMTWAFQRSVPHADNRCYRSSDLTPSKFKAYLQAQAQATTVSD
jgi:transposase